jgi:DNA-binding SARP family transcriptional activator
MHGSSREAVVVSVMDLSLASDVAVDVRESQALAHRLLDTRSLVSPTDVSADSIDALSADLLPDWYDDWVVVETEAWRQLRLHALEALSDRLVDAGRLADAAGAALTAVNAEPLRESSRAALIRVHLSEGNQSEALTEFERYRVLLHAELGLEPTRRLGELLDGLREL